ncbi:hypothetical protein PFLUV_G00196990 [Perca fluviatilis]|uniref:C2H2-type domain-containing protein n=1 Tax=Perca fluviatilis TaxID=8168 RepID=A0A6A5ESQ3_PERFL|nr:hypothetical protein PFLUV_G00196990 [Perca fluviatilis]
MLWRCVICLVFLTFSLKQLLSHINRMHSRSPDFRLLCGIDGCTEEYRVYNSFYHHVKRRHSQHLIESNRPGDGNHVGEQPQEESQGTHQQQDNIQLNFQGTLVSPINSSVHLIQMKGKWTLTKMELPQYNQI